MQPKGPVYYLELPNTLTTMPRNIVAGKAAIGLLNTSNSKMITILTPQAELAAANAKIK